jgi:hypothetical protein
MDWTIWDASPNKDDRFLLLHNIHTRSRAHPVCYWMGTNDSFHGGVTPLGHKADHSNLPPRWKMTWAAPPFSLSAFLANTEASLSFTVLDNIQTDENYTKLPCLAGKDLEGSSCNIIYPSLLLDKLERPTENSSPASWSKGRNLNAVTNQNSSNIQ